MRQSFLCSSGLLHLSRGNPLVFHDIPPHRISYAIEMFVRDRNYISDNEIWRFIDILDARSGYQIWIRYVMVRPTEWIYNWGFRADRIELREEWAHTETTYEEAGEGYLPSLWARHAHESTVELNQAQIRRATRVTWHLHLHELMRIFLQYLVEQSPGSIASTLQQWIQLRQCSRGVRRLFDQFAKPYFIYDWPRRRLLRRFGRRYYGHGGYRYSTYWTRESRAHKICSTCRIGNFEHDLSHLPHTCSECLCVNCSNAISLQAEQRVPRTASSHESWEFYKTSRRVTADREAADRWGDAVLYVYRADRCRRCYTW